MKNIFYGLNCVIASICITLSPFLDSSILASAAPLVTQQNKFTQPDFAQHFRDLGVKGSILIYDLERDRTYQHNPERNVTPFLPASTFKVLNSLIALETGVIDNELSILTWDGVERSIPAWNRDLNMQTAIQVSAVWFYQVLARRIGYERMQQWIAKVGYGNQAIGEADDIDTFWLTGDLRITPHQQIQFLRRLHKNELPFSDDAIATVKNIMIVERTPDYTMRAKTGWASESQIGWYVGYVEQDDNTYFFATNINIRDEADLSTRAAVTRQSLKSLKVL
ncbi:class D beta-lactamase [Acaryochloris thomasi]|nr:class D beta-lactamase [Acaryochloris thomasi]